LKYLATGDKILSAVGISLAIFQKHNDLQRNVIAVFKGGVITEKGLAYPDTIIAVAFPSSIVNITAPTPLLTYGIIR